MKQLVCVYLSHFRCDSTVLYASLLAFETARNTAGQRFPEVDCVSLWPEKGGLSAHWNTLSGCSWQYFDGKVLSDQSDPQGLLAQGILAPMPLSRTCYL